MARGDFEIYIVCLEAHPAHDAFHEAAAFGQCVHGVHHLPVQQAEITRAFGQFYIADLVEQPVVELAEFAAQPMVGIAVLAQAIDHLRARLPFGDHLRQHFGRVLQVAIHDDGGIALRMDQPAGDRVFLAEIARQLQALDARVARVVFLEPFEGFILAAIIDADDLVTARNILQHRFKAAEQNV